MCCLAEQCLRAGKSITIEVWEKRKKKLEQHFIKREKQENVYRKQSAGLMRDTIFWVWKNFDSNIFS